MDQAEQTVVTESESIDSLASFLMDNPAADSDGTEKKEEAKTDEATQTDKAETEEQQKDEATNDTESDEETEGDEKPADEPAKASLKFKVPIKDESGADTTVEVDEKELISGYQRQADYTRKTQQLAERERDVTTKVAERLVQEQQHYLQQSQIAQLAIRQVSGLKTPEEMAQLASTDPAQWVLEQQRERAISGILAQLEQGVQGEFAKQQAAQKEAETRAYKQTWEVLTKEGIDPPKLKKIFDVMSSDYSVTAAQLAKVNDPTLVRIMRDAAAYRELQKEKPAVTKKATEAPRLPAQRQTTPRSEQRAKALTQRFSTGKATLNDLAAYLNQ
jgi:hypothetical protein